ncbi:reverse transcriptase [Lithospermum erythrorhizon]|uniref:Reverse transcriptase n=1 Tax=Lithospermum erythrorhizon TaxID=34254 RepID=A0AAV3QWT0_LITER
MTVVYAASKAPLRRVLWKDLTALAVLYKPWVLMGDFNAITSRAEHKGAAFFDPGSAADFNAFISTCELSDAGFIGSPFTRSCGLHYSRLDRVLCDSSFLNAFPVLSVRHLVKTNSDHAPLLINIQSHTGRVKSSFRFQNMWIKHKDFQSVVAAVWKQEFFGDPFFIICSKLKALKLFLKEWNRNTFGNVTSMVETAEEDVRQCEVNFELSGSTAHKEALLLAKSKHLQCIDVEEAFLAQKSGIKWMKEGDRSTGYFHAVIKKKNRLKQIPGILDDGVWITDKPLIAESASNYFKKAFSGDSNDVHMEDLHNFIPQLVTQDQNDLLMAKPSLQEVKNTVFSLDKSSVAGPDGFNGFFFQEFWNLIDEDVYRAVLYFMDGHAMPRSLTSTVISLIPKCDGPCSWKQFRPISLCNFLNKVISKLLSNRLAIVLPGIISESQSGFVKGRVIQDNIMLTQEFIHHIDHTAKGGNVLLKLDMTRAFDMLSWKFLQLILRKFGFSETFISRILDCVGNSWFSVLVNGELSGFFPSTKGLRQGDPLSPCLFILAEDYLLRGLCSLYSDYPSLAYNTHCKVVIPCLAFADDCIIFSNGSKSSLSKIMQLLEHYQSISGQVINTDKSSCLFSSKLSTCRANMILKSTNFRKESMPFSYLGIPIYKGRKQVFLFDDLIVKIVKAISSWEHRFLSFGGRIVLIQSVLSAFPLYYLQVLKMPIQVKEKIEKLLNKFLWGNSSHWCSWSHLCFKFEEGGLNFKKLDDIAAASMIKAWFRLREGKGIWSKYMLAKYCRLNHPSNAIVNEHHSRLWNSITAFRDPAELHIAWHIGAGSCDFWLDSWLPSGPINSNKPHGTKVKDFFLHGAWNICKLKDFLQEDVRLQEILQISFIETQPDCILWKPAKNGLFNFNSAWEISRKVKPLSPIHSLFWHSFFPKKMSFLSWRLLLHWLPVDSILQTRNTSLASKCVCCNHVESLQHVFFTNPVAANIWSSFAEDFGFSSNPITNIQHAFQVWSLCCSTKGHVRQLIPVIILWALWEARNKAIHEHRVFSFKTIRTRIENLLYYLGKADLLHYKHWKGDLHVAQRLNITVYRSPRKPPLLLKWIKPPRGKLKVNTDGAFKEGFAGLGGVIRNEDGHCFAAIGMSTIGDSPLHAELLAAAQLLKWCKSQGYNNLIVETDSAIMMKMVEKQQGHWSLYSLMRQLTHLLDSTLSSLVLVKREQNRGADWIAKEALSKKSDFCWSPPYVNKTFRGIISSEAAELPYIRG